jgi:histidinol-phosphate aminotransferase
MERASGRRFILRLGANENAFGPSPRAIDAAIGELRRSAWYADPESYDLRKAISRAIGAHATELLVGGGIDDLMGLVIRCVIEPGDVAVATSNTYAIFEYHIRGYGGLLHTIPYRDDMCVDLEGLARLVSKYTTRIVYVANPDNPTGSYAPVEELEAFIARLPASTLLMLDEAYSEFVRPVPEDLKSSAWDKANVIRFRTFSKGYGLAGLHIGYLVGPAHYIEAMEKVRTQYGVNRVAQAAAIAALSDAAHLEAVVREVGEMRTVYAEMGRRQGWQPLASQTNFVTFDVGSASNAKRLVQALGTRGVFVRGGNASPVKGYVRVTIGTESECRELEKVLAAI